MERVVATDLEGTLTAGSTWRGVGRYLSEHGHRGRYRRFFWLRLPQVFLARRGIIDLQAFRERWMHDLTALLRGMSREQIEAMADWVFEQELWPGRRDDVLDELQCGPRRRRADRRRQRHLHAHRVALRGTAGSGGHRHRPCLRRRRPSDGRLRGRHGHAATRRSPG